MVTINKAFIIKEEAFEGDIDRFLNIPESHDELLRKAETYRNAEYETTVTRLPDGEWLAEHPDLPGCRMHGKTQEEALARLEDVRVSWIYAAMAEGIGVPEPGKGFVKAEAR